MCQYTGFIIAAQQGPANQTARLFRFKLQLPRLLFMFSLARQPAEAASW